MGNPLWDLLFETQAGKMPSGEHTTLAITQFNSLQEKANSLDAANARIAELQALLKPFADIYEKLMRGDEAVTLGNGDIYKRAYLALSGDKEE